MDKAELSRFLLIHADTLAKKIGNHRFLGAPLTRISAQMCDPDNIQASLEAYEAALAAMTSPPAKSSRAKSDTKVMPPSPAPA